MPKSFYTAPADITPGIQMLTRGIESYGDYRREQAKEQKNIELRREATEVIQRGNPDEIAEFVGKNPEAKQVYADIVGVENQIMLDQSKRWLINQEDPGQIHINAAEQAIAEGRDPSGNIEMARAVMGQETREQARKMHENVLAMLDPTAYKQYKGMKGELAGKDTANIKDWKYYRELQKKDPEMATLFAKQIGIKDDKPDIKPTTAMRNFKKYMEMPEGEDKQNFAKIIGIDPKETVANQMKKAEKADELSGEVENANMTIELADNLLSNDDYLNAVAGVSGVLPSIPGTTKKDAMVAFDQLKNSLTLDNLSKMSGVLSDSDIKILRSAGAGMEEGMSKPALERRLKQIKKILSGKKTSIEKKIGKLTTKLEDNEITQEEYNKLPSGATYQYGGKTYRKQ